MSVLSWEPGKFWMSCCVSALKTGSLTELGWQPASLDNESTVLGLQAPA